MLSSPIRLNVVNILIWVPIYTHPHAQASLNILRFKTLQTSLNYYLYVFLYKLKDTWNHPLKPKETERLIVLVYFFAFIININPSSAMAKAVFLNFCIVLLIINIIVCHGILPTEARHLGTHRKPIKNRKATFSVHDNSSGLSTTAVGSVKKSSISNEEHGVDQFRPTAPGNSPGIGHSIKT